MMRVWCLTSVWRLSCTSGLNREQRGPGRAKLAQRYPTSHMTRTPLSGSKGQGSRSPDRFTRRGLNAWGRCSGDRENVLGVGNYCYVASAWRRWGRRRGGEGRGISCRHAHSLFCLLTSLYDWWNTSRGTFNIYSTVSYSVVCGRFRICFIYASTVQL